MVIQVGIEHGFAVATVAPPCVGWGRPFAHSFVVYETIQILRVVPTLNVVWGIAFHPLYCKQFY